MLAMRSGVPRLFPGWRWSDSARVSGSIQPVSTGPGLTTFAVIPNCTNSLAAASTIRSSAPLLAPYGKFPAVWSLVRAIIFPPPAGICRANSRTSCQLALAFTAKCLSKLSTEVSRIPELTDSQCDKTRAVTGPSCFVTTLKICSAALVVSRSASMEITRLPCLLSSSTTSPVSSPSRPHGMRLS